MIRKLVFLLFLTLLMVSMLQAADATIKGVVKGKDSGNPLAGANVFLKGTSYGSSTNNQGEYSIVNVSAGTYRLVISYIGFAQHAQDVTVSEAAELAVNIDMEKSELISEQIVVTASKGAEKITEAPATIDVIMARDVAEHPSANVGELLAYQKGVDYIRTGVVGTGMNIRGFNSAFNAKNLQMNDTRLSTLVATGLPLGVLSSTVKDDIERIEVILGPSAALYGPNAHNGLINTITKDPRNSQGTTFAVGGGSQSTIGGRLRHAKVVNDKFAYKVSAEYAQGEEFSFVDSVYVGGVGFDELGLDRDFDSMRGEASLYFTPATGSDVILSYGGSLSNNLGVTNAGRNQIKDWQVHYLQARYVSPKLFAQVYHTWSKTEDTYAINQRTQNYLTFINAGFSEEEALRRSLHEQWAGATPDAGIALNRDANFKDKSRRWNAETQYNNTWSGFQVTAGAQWQRDIANSKGTYLIDDGGNSPINLDQFGVYGQVEKPLGDTGAELVLAARGDDHELYGFNFIPKAGLLFSQGNSTWRVTYGKGIAAPTILNLSANIFGGLLLGNGEGFTLADGSKIEKLEVENIQTIELGYKGLLSEKFYLDGNAYYNMHENFISPLINIANFPAGPVVSHRGDQVIDDLNSGVFGPGDFLLTYLNFGEVQTFGLDLGLNYFINQNMSFRLNYSFFDFDLDTKDTKNDGNRDGNIDENDLPINTPKHKLNASLNLSHDTWFGSLGARWVDEYDFFSGINIAAATNNDLTYGGDPVVEGQRVGRDFNEGPLGGFVNLDIGLGYRVNKNFTVSGQVINILDSDVREFVASPAIGRLFSLELKYIIF